MGLDQEVTSESNMAKPAQEQAQPPTQVSDNTQKGLDPTTAQIVADMANSLQRSLTLTLQETFDVFKEQHGIKTEQQHVAGSSQVSAGLLSDDERVLLQDLQSTRQREKQLKLLVDDLQTEHRLLTEKLSLHSTLSLKLRKELINERLALIDCKKEIDELRLQYEVDTESTGNKNNTNTSATPSGAPTGSTSTGKDLMMSPSPTQQDSLLWHTSPTSKSGATSSTSATAASAAASKPSTKSNLHGFYSSSPSMPTDSTRGMSRRHDDEDELEDDDDMMDPDSSLGGLQPLRNSFIGQLLPSSLLDSPQVVPKSLDYKEDDAAKDNDDDNNNQQLEQRATSTLRKTPVSSSGQPGPMDSFSLNDSRCDNCDSHPVAKSMPCGHPLCAKCKKDSIDNQRTTCANCGSTLASIDDLLQPEDEEEKPETPVATSESTLKEEDNQVEHLVKSPSSISSKAKAATSSSISPMTLSLLNEIFDAISVEELEQIAKTCNNQVSQMIDHIIQNHPIFNPASASGTNTGNVPASSAESTSRNTRGNAPMPGVASNWKTEICVYYLQGKCNKTRRTCSFAHGESDLVKTNTSKHASSNTVAFKSRMCPLYLEGCCPKSRRDCPLAHGESDLRDGLAVLSANAANANNAAQRQQNYKTEMCYYYLKGCCNYTKEECRFAHGESDLRTYESNTMEWASPTPSAAVASSAGPSHFTDFTSDRGTNVNPPLLEKQLAQQHQYQLQYQQTHFQNPLQPPPVSAAGSMPTMSPNPQQQLQHQHQMQHQHQHQQHHHQHQLQQHQGSSFMGMPGSNVPMIPPFHAKSPQAPPAASQPMAGPGGQPPNMFHLNRAPPQMPQFRYMKNVEDPRRSMIPPPPRREHSWTAPSNYDMP